MHMSQASDRALSPTPHYYEIMGRAAEIARAVGSPAGGAERGIPLMRTR